MAANYFKLTLDVEPPRCIAMVHFDDETRAAVARAWQNARELADEARGKRGWVWLSVYRSIPWHGLWSGVALIGEPRAELEPEHETKPRENKYKNSEGTVSSKLQNPPLTEFQLGLFGEPPKTIEQEVGGNDARP